MARHHSLSDHLRVLVDLLAKTNEKKRKRFSLGEKLEAVRMLSTGSDATDFINKFDVKRRTVTKLRKDADHLLKKAEKDRTALHAKYTRPPKFPHIEERFLQFLHLARTAKMPVTQEVIQQRALLSLQRLLQLESNAIDKEARMRFTDSVDGYKSSLSGTTSTQLPFRGQLEV